jgi:hypothetical protein
MNSFRYDQDVIGGIFNTGKNGVASDEIVFRMVC